MKENEPKRKYTKHKKTSKIGIRHYVNNNVKPLGYNGREEPLYPIYIQLTYKRETLRFKSELSFKIQQDSDLLIDSIKDSIEYESAKISNCLPICYERFAGNPKLSDVINLYTSEFRLPLNDIVEIELTKLIHKFKFKTPIDYDNCNFLSEFKNPYFSLSTLLQSANAIDIIEVLEEYFPEIILLKKEYSSKIWHFNGFYKLFQTKHNLINSMLDKFTITKYTIYEFITEDFQREFLKQHSNSINSLSIINDLEKLLKKYKMSTL